MTRLPRCVLHEDEHLLVVRKPAGWNTHAPSPHAGEGIYDWLRHREPRWASLAIVHRLDKDTSGVLVFGEDAARKPLADGTVHEARGDASVTCCSRTGPCPPGSCAWRRRLPARATTTRAGP